MDLYEAYSVVESLPCWRRALFGRDKGHNEIEWYGCDLFDLERLRGVAFVCDVGEQLMEAIDSFDVDRRGAVVNLFRTPFGGAYFFLVLGLEMPEQLADMLRSSIGDITHSRTKAYLVNLLGSWKRSLALKVLPLPRNNRRRRPTRH
ncbi:hypothetical protein ACJ51O_35555 (plasmid) [Burkholderia pyrrocinia]|uniref:hypothetical protein n=1 Tax=Burkholderia pyrrocinia TaxID=60550 RepID=UPI0038B63046